MNVTTLAVLKKTVDLAKVGIEYIQHDQQVLLGLRKPQWVVFTGAGIGRGNYTNGVHPMENIIMDCECKNWCSIDIREVMLTGHHRNCEHNKGALNAAYALLAELTKGIGAWAAEEDGVHSDLWPAYRKAKALEGVYLKEDQE